MCVHYTYRAMDTGMAGKGGFTAPATRKQILHVDSSVMGGIVDYVYSPSGLYTDKQISQESLGKHYQFRTIVQSFSSDKARERDRERGERERKRGS